MVEDDKVDLQVVTMKQLKEVVEQMNNNTEALHNKVQSIGVGKVKLPSIERFDGTRSKLKGFLSQIRFKVTQEGLKIGTTADQVAYAGLFLTGRALEWFEPYLTEFQTNGATTTNQEVKYMFSSWEGFSDRLIQMYGNPEATTTAERKLLELTQRGSATDYTTMF